MLLIIENGHAYGVDGDVYFSVEKFPNYGRLSGRKLEDNRAGERVSVDSRKRNPADFALWKVYRGLDIGSAKPSPGDRKEVPQGEEGKWVDWEDKILEDTVPLAGFVRMILHFGKYESGDRLSPEHEKTVLERLLPFYPEAAKKIGCGIDYVTLLFGTIS